uniref:Activin_recp domain-containing protein n=1 Tax=Syphacia muris TaxID=451379 RepID=A0A0N5AP90_9BILA
MLLKLLLIASVMSIVASLKCYSEFSTVNGSPVGTTTIECPKSTDSCYRIHANLAIINLAKKAGCSTYRCSMSKNKCTAHDLNGVSVSFCCCNDRDLCNSAISYFNLSSTLITVFSCITFLYYLTTKSLL